MLWSIWRSTSYSPHTVIHITLILHLLFQRHLSINWYRQLRGKRVLHIRFLVYAPELMLVGSNSNGISSNLEAFFIHHLKSNPCERNQLNVPEVNFVFVWCQWTTAINTLISLISLRSICINAYLQCQSTYGLGALQFCWLCYQFIKTFQSMTRCIKIQFLSIYSVQYTVC